MLRLDVISFICTSYIALSRQFWRDISQIIVIPIKKNIYIKFINRFKFDYHNTTIILLPYRNNLPTITIIKCEWLRVSLESIKTVGVKNREDRENKGMSRRTIRPEQLPPHPFGVNNWPAMRDGISSTGFLPMLIAWWNCNHGWTWHVGKKSFRITAHGLRMASIERSSKRPSIGRRRRSTFARTFDYPPRDSFTVNNRREILFAAISFSIIIRHSIILERVALLDA